MQLTTLACGPTLAEWAIPIAPGSLLIALNHALSTISKLSEAYSAIINDFTHTETQ